MFNACGPVCAFKEVDDEICAGNDVSVGDHCPHLNFCMTSLLRLEFRTIGLKRGERLISRRKLRRILISIRCIR